MIEWGIAVRAMTGQTECGDMHKVLISPGGALLAMVDGLGHGPDAARAARTAVELLEQHAGKPLDDMINCCHEGLRRTRGVVMTVAQFDAKTSSMAWVGVGNVKAVLLRVDPAARPAKEGILQRPGVVGYQIGRPRVSVLSVEHGDTVILTTDGIRSAFQEDLNELVRAHPPEQAAAHLLGRFARAADDAAVLVARYVGFDVVPEHLPIRGESDVITARKRTRALAQREGLSEGAVAELETATSEVAQNILRHAVRGEITIAVSEDPARRGVIVIARDEGPGILNPERALQGGYSSAGGLGLGLSGARRLVSEIELSTEVGRGTTVTLRKWRK
jgi:negative regulator of sigma-B (phosphoserine phosphatase)